MMTPAKSKYRNEPISRDGIKFASKREANRYANLRLLELGGEIRNLKRQVPIMLMGATGPVLTRTGRQMRLTVDFTYEDKRLNWATVYEDAKGAATRDYEVRRGVAQAMGLTIAES